MGQVSLKATDEFLSQTQLEAFAERAAHYDETNSFFTEDWEEIKQSGYLLMPVPRELGGFGYNLAEVQAEQRRLAYYAPADALAVNMHLFWVGIAADLRKHGDDSLEWILQDAAAGEVFASGHAEPQGGYDASALYSNTVATPVDGGYRLSGRKAFGSLSPVWTRYAANAEDRSDPDNPKSVHVFLTRDSDGIEILNNWNTLGMRATQSHDTVLDKVFVPDHYVARVVPTGFGGIDDFVFRIFVYALTGFANVYCGLAKRAFDMVCGSVKTKRVNTMTRSYAWNGEVQHQIAEMAMKLNAIESVLDRTAEDWSNDVDHGDLWSAKIVGTKTFVVENAWEIVSAAFDLSGGYSIFKGSPWERMIRDARLGMLHPANGVLAREIVAKTHLGLDPDEIPRWG